MIKIHSIFESISGEAGPVIPQGAWTTFIRTQGCNIRCKYCDTKKAQNINSAGTYMSVDEIADACNTKYVLITGGEPLLWGWELQNVINGLLSKGCIIQVETNGTTWPMYYDIPPKAPLGFVMDIKGPSSGMHQLMPSPNHITEIVNTINQAFHLDFKFVVQDQTDLDFAKEYMQTISDYVLYGNAQFIRFIISPMNAEPNKKVLDEIKKLDQNILDRVIISLQIHKILNMD